MFLRVVSTVHLRILSVSLQVSQWLRKVFGQQPVPEFEVNTRTVEVLYELAENSEMRCRETELLIQDHKQKTEEYSSDGETDTVTNIVWPMCNDSVSVQFFCCGPWQELISKKCFSRQWDFRLEVFPNPQWTCCQCWRKPPKCLNSETLHLGGKIILDSSYITCTRWFRHVPALCFWNLILTLKSNRFIFKLSLTFALWVLWLISHSWLSSYMPAINKLTNDVLEAEKTDRRLQRELSALRKKMTVTVVLRKKLQE